MNVSRETWLWPTCVGTWRDGVLTPDGDYACSVCGLLFDGWNMILAHDPLGSAVQWPSPLPHQRAIVQLPSPL